MLAGPTPVGWRESKDPAGRDQPGKLQGRGGFDKGTLAAAQIGLTRAGQKPSPIARQAYGQPPLIKSTAPSINIGTTDVPSLPMSTRVRW